MTDNPNGTNPVRLDRSVPRFNSPKLVRRNVSPERSAAKVFPEISTAVRQQPFTAMLPDFARPSASGPALMRILAPVKSECDPGAPVWAPTVLRSTDSTTPTYSTSPVNIAQISLDRKIRSELRQAHIAQDFCTLKSTRDSCHA